MLIAFEGDKFNYHIYDLKTRKISITHHATFNENSFPYEEKGVVKSINDKTQVTPVAMQFFNDDSDSQPLVETDQQ